MCCIKSQKGAGSQSGGASGAPAQGDLARALRFNQGGSRKFWLTGLRGAELRMDKLVAEKLRKGYMEDQEAKTRA
ncbi:hypothetical protein [Ralstonia solanacearum]|uniref:hypothetical protein n=1 Tax=Ralstonia solanacearum TaxID=305 RepID=UPI001E5B2C43|nr:hypothetical protein [Ralstonia solanacearum]